MTAKKSIRKKAGNKPWIPTPEMLAKAESFGALGMTQADIARCLGIHPHTFSMKKNDFPELREALKRGEAKGLAQVASDLMKNCRKGNPASQMFYLKCRGKGKWNDNEALRLLDARLLKMERKSGIRNDDNGEVRELDSRCDKEQGCIA